MLLLLFYRSSSSKIIIIIIIIIKIITCHVGDFVGRLIRFVLLLLLLSPLLLLLLLLLLLKLYFLLSFHNIRFQQIEDDRPPFIDVIQRSCAGENHFSREEHQRNHPEIRVPENQSREYMRLVCGVDVVSLIQRFDIQYLPVADVQLAVTDHVLYFKSYNSKSLSCAYFLKQCPHAIG